MKTISTLTLDGVGTFKYSERVGSPQESFSGDTFRAKRIFDVPYNARWAFIQYMVGDAYVTSRGNIQRILPDQYYAQWGNLAQQAYGATKAFMTCTGVESIEPLGQQYENYTNFGPGTKITFASYDIARVTLTYSSVTYDILSDEKMGGQSEYYCLRYVSIFRQPTAEFLTLPMGAFKWVELDDDGKVKIDKKTNRPAGIRVSGSNGKIVSAAEVIMIHHQVPGISPAIKTHIGCVNKNDWKEMRAKAGQLLLTNAEIKPYKWLDGRRLYDVTYKFKFLDPDPKGTLENPSMPRGHNWFLQFYPVDVSSKATEKDLLEGMPEYKLITHDGTLEGRRVYEYADMKDLFEDLDPDAVDIPVVI